MRALGLIVTASLACGLVACGAATETPKPEGPGRTTVAPVAPTPSAEPVASAPPTAVTAPAENDTLPPTPPLPTGPYRDLTASPGDVRLDAAVAQVKAGAHAAARTELERVLPDIDKTGNLDAKLVAHALLGRTCQSLGDAPCAIEHFRAVRDLWKDPTAATATLDALGGDDMTKARRLGTALTAVGEALFFAAEQKRLVSEKESFPRYRGGSEQADVKKHFSTAVVPWLRSRRASIAEVEKAYLEILSLQPLAPPRWVASAAARTGGMWWFMMTQVHKAPMPDEWKRVGSDWEILRATYVQDLDDSLTPMMEKTRAAYKVCSAYSVKFAYKDALTQECDDWLAKHPDRSATP